MRYFIFILALFSFFPIPQKVLGETRPDAKFFCGTYQGKPATIARTSRGDVPIFLWTSQVFSPSYPPQKRCEIVSQRLDKLFTGGGKYFANGNVNGHPVICIVKNRSSKCSANNIITALSPEENSQEILENLIEIRSGASGPIERSNEAVDIQEFLENAPIVDQLQNTNQNLSPRNSRSSNDAKNNYYLGLRLRGEGKIEEAIAAYRQAIKIDPNFFEAYNSLGIILFDSGKIEEAITNYQKAIQINPKYSYVYNNLGIAFHYQNQFDKAISAYEKALTLPDLQGSPASVHTLAYNGLGYIWQQKGEYEKAINYYQKAINLDPNFVTAQNNLKEAERLLTLKTVPPVIDDLAYLPNIQEEPLVPYLRSTVRIIANLPQGQGPKIGTGWVMKRESKTLWIVTNRHIICDGRSERISNQIFTEFYSELPDEKRPRYPAMVEKYTPCNDSTNLDLAVLKVTGIPDDIQAFVIKLGRIARSDVTIIGHPFNVPTPWTSVTGKVMNYSPNQDQIPLDVTVAEGNSGGPVINEKGEIVAMMVSIQGFGDIASDPNIATPWIPENTNTTGGIGLAYRMDVIIEQLKEWGYEM